VAESYRLWLNYETRTDDITMIVLQFCGLDSPQKLPLEAPVAAPQQQSPGPPIK